jgi:hypothetical protein
MMIRRVTAAAICAASAGCMSVQPVWEPAPFMTPAGRSARVVYVTHQSGAVLAIVNPRVSGDSVYGTLRGEDRPVAVQLSEVSSIATSRLNGKRTAMLVGAVTAVSGLAFVSFINSATGRNNWECDFSISAREANGGAPICGPR